jgi:acid phosphatase (class A)
LILSPPPATESAVTAAELAELHRIETTRTPAQIAQAQTDDREEDIFLFKSVMGPGFTAEALPVTALLSAHVRKDESSAGSPLKNIYRRPRPYQADSTLHPVCPLNPGPTSYPSGHSLSGYLLAFTLVQLVPEKREQIFERADEYVHNRLVCGVHYASDIEASRRVAYAIFGSMAASPNF